MYWKLDEELALSPAQHYNLKRQAVLTYLETHLQLHHHHNPYALLKEGVKFAEAYKRDEETANVFFGEDSR